MPQLWHWSRLWLQSDPWPRNPICCGVANKGGGSKLQIKGLMHSVTLRSQLLLTLYSCILSSNTYFLQINVLRTMYSTILAVLELRGPQGQTCCDEQTLELIGHSHFICHLAWANDEKNLLRWKDPNDTRNCFYLP